MKYFRILLLILPLAGFFTSCDKIEPPYIEGTLPPDTTECPVPDFPADTHHVRTVLIEEYTGHKCVNCPTAAVTAHEILNTYGEKVVLMAIHAGYFAQTESGNYSLDLNSTAGTDLYNNYGITNNPAAMFNRKSISGVNIFEAYPTWEATFLDVQDTVPTIDIQMIINYNSSESKACIHVQTEYLVDVDRPLKLALYVTEDSIHGYQKNNNSGIGPTPDIPNYVFMNVLRGSVNGTWGSDLNTGDVEADSNMVSSFKLILNANWVAKNCHIVAVVYDPSTDEIWQAAEEKIVP